jgi:hypothetical protein
MSRPRSYPAKFQRVELNVRLVFGLPDYLMEQLGPLDQSPEDALLALEQALESGELTEADILTMLADRARSSK